MGLKKRLMEESKLTVENFLRVDTKLHFPSEDLPTLDVKVFGAVFSFSCTDEHMLQILEDAAQEYTMDFNQATKDVATAFDELRTSDTKRRVIRALKETIVTKRSYKKILLDPMNEPPGNSQAGADEPITEEGYIVVFPFEIISSKDDNTEQLYSPDKEIQIECSSVNAARFLYTALVMYNP